MRRLAIAALAVAAVCVVAEPGLAAVSKNVIRGTKQNDSLVGTPADDEITGLAGDDSLKGGAGSDGLDGGTGNDTVIGGAGLDWVFGGPGDDVLRSDTDLLVKGGAGNDSIYVVNKVQTNIYGEQTDSLLSLQMVGCDSGRDSLTIAGRVLNKSLISRVMNDCETVRFTR